MPRDEERARREAEEAPDAAEVPEETAHGNRPLGPAGYEEAGGSGLVPDPDDHFLEGGTSGSDEDPIAGPGIPDEVQPDRVASGPDGGGGEEERRRDR